jgi:hypothetical protein
MANDLLLVGSIPRDTVEDVFTEFGGSLGPHLASLPDGEVGPRSHWISRVHYQVLANHSQIDVVQTPSLVDGVERLFPQGAGDSWKFKVKDGVDIVRFGDPGWRLGYARDAVNSYFVFKTLREKSAIASHLRFQVSMPSVISALPPRLFPNPADIEKVRTGYQQALAAELGTIVERIPAEDLALQWDCSTEMQDSYGAVPGFETNEDTIERNLGQFRALSPLVPEGALLGYHLCFGTLGGWPRFEPDDLSGAVKMANGIIGASGRRVDWVHIPVLDRTNDAFYAPLKDLKPAGARVYLGMIHNMDSFDARMAAAKKFLPDFGLAAYCGMGRVAPLQLSGVLDDHLRAVAASS